MHRHRELAEDVERTRTTYSIADTRSERADRSLINVQEKGQQEDRLPAVLGELVLNRVHGRLCETGPINATWDNARAHASWRPVNVRATTMAAPCCGGSGAVAGSDGSVWSYIIGIALACLTVAPARVMIITVALTVLVVC